MNSIKNYIRNRLNEPVSGVGGTIMSGAAIYSLDYHSPDFWVFIITGVLQIVLPESNWPKIVTGIIKLLLPEFKWFQKQKPDEGMFS